MEERPFQCVRENSVFGMAVEQSPLEASRKAASYVSPARKRWVKWGMRRSPEGTARVLTHPLGAGAYIFDFFRSYCRNAASRRLALIYTVLWKEQRLSPTWACLQIGGPVPIPASLHQTVRRDAVF